MEWVTVDRPGHAGKDKQERNAERDARFGEDNWRTAWTWNGSIITRELAYQIYEDGYYHDSFEREDVWRELISVASDVYDLEPLDVESGLDYFVQQGIANHLQDIAVRRVVQRRGWNFEGDELVRVRKHDEYWGDLLSPGRVPFHMPELIANPHLEDWWDYDSIEDFYQSNKVLQVKKGLEERL